MTRVQPSKPAYVPRHGIPDSAEKAPAQTPLAPQIPKLPDRDLALSTPGQAAREQAFKLRHAARLRTFQSRVAGEKTDERAWRIGADAEVARRLLTLGPDWFVLHSVPVGDNISDIDHVVIGPSGVLRIHTKHHPQAYVWVGGDVVKVNNFNQPYVRNSRHEAARAAKLLTAAAQFDVDVHGVVAIMGAHKGFTVSEEPHAGALSIVTRKQVAAHLQNVRSFWDGRPSIGSTTSRTTSLPGSQRRVGWQDFG